MKRDCKWWGYYFHSELYVLTAFCFTTLRLSFRRTLTPSGTLAAYRMSLFITIHKALFSSNIQGGFIEDIMVKKLWKYYTFLRKKITAVKFCGLFFHYFTVYIRNRYIQIEIGIRTPQRHLVSHDIHGWRPLGGRCRYLTQSYSIRDLNISYTEVKGMKKKSCIFYVTHDTEWLHPSGIFFKV